ncbi:MAG TPA: hypothetical protein VGA78_18370 [Gemmatimonadales bacterium]
MSTGVTHIPKATEAALMGKEELIRAILDVLDRTWTEVEGPGALQWLEEFFRKLDEPTLRAIGYQQGAFEPDLEPDEGESRSAGPGQTA